MMSKEKEHIRLDERNHVEEPFLAELKRLGWHIINLDKKARPKERQTPEDSFRESFSDVIMLPKLCEAIKKINPWIEEDQIDDVAKRITHLSKSGLIEANQVIQQLLLENTSVHENRETKEKSPTVRYVDFKNPKNNNFVAVSQLKVRIIGTEYHIYPDIVLFLNGLPVVVIEAKSPKLREPISEAIDQLMRYSEQRGEKNEGNKSLFYYNQFVIATCRNECKFGTISSHIEKWFFRWSDPYPKSIDEIGDKGKSPNNQVRMIHGMLNHTNLLSLIKTFTLFSENEKGQTVKIVARYQQFRAVKKIVERLLEGKNKLQRGGIIWHTQGSGKSLTMMFTVREMYAHDKLKDWKIIFITDRTQLESQLNKTSNSIGYTVKTAYNIHKLKELLSNPSSDLVMGMIHKFQERELEEIFPVLNESPKILVMTDEAHRSQYKKLAANLDKALPEATHIGYTGTPTDKTEKKYKDYIDKYTMRQSINDGVTLEIVYEGRTHKGIIKDKKGMDKTFADVFSEYTLKEQLDILGYGSRDAYLEAKETIAAKAKDMIEHYVNQVFPNGFKAQIVTTSREAASRYKDAIDASLKIKIVELSKKNPFLIDIKKLKSMKTAVVISGANNDKPHIKKYTDENKHEKDIDSFKLSFDAEEEGTKGDVGIIIVNNMLLTGFDAPLEQVMYLDKFITAHNLLQAIARVNRVSNDKKEKGFIVDYIGVGNHLKEAIDNFDEREQKEIIDTFENEQDELNELIFAQKKMFEFLKHHSLKDLNDFDSFYDLFYDEDMRFDFIERFKQFAKALDIVFPRKEALEFMPDFKKFVEINALAEKHLRDNRMSMKGIPDKLRVIADQYLVSLGINQKIAPISIIDEKFQENVGKIKRKRTKAAEVEHAIRHFIDERYNEDPELYASFTKMLEEILQGFKENWDKIYEHLEKLRGRIKTADKEPTYGLHRKKQMPFFRILKKEIYNDTRLTDDQISLLVNLTQELFLGIDRELKLTNFWENIPARSRLKSDLVTILISEEYKKYIPDVFSKRNAIASRIIETAESINDTILYAD